MDFIISALFFIAANQANALQDKDASFIARLLSCFLIITAIQFYIKGCFLYYA
jgi:hypothetical protein